MHARPIAIDMNALPITIHMLAQQIIFKLVTVDMPQTTILQSKIKQHNNFNKIRKLKDEY